MLKTKIYFYKNVYLLNICIIFAKVNITYKNQFSDIAINKSIN